MPDQESTMIPQPCNASLNGPSSPITTQGASVLKRRTFTSLTMRADQINASVSQVQSQRVAVGSLVIDQSLNGFLSLGVGCNMVQCRLDQRRFRRGRRGKVNSQRKTLAVDHHHKLRTLSAFGLSDAIAPFLAAINVPSPNVSSQIMRPFSSSCATNARHISSHTSCSSQKRNRLQHVLGLGYRSGKSFQRAPERKTHRIPSKQSRSDLHGAPPLGCLGNSGRCGLIFSHIASLTNGLFRAIGSSPPALTYSPIFIQKLAKNVLFLDSFSQYDQLAEIHGI